jgi:hypothetical protein
MYQFKLVGLTVSAPDVTVQELSVKIGDADAVVQSLAPEILEVAGFQAEKNTTVAVSLTDIDEDGNRSEPRLQTFTVKDTMAPPMPGEIGLIVTGQTP